MAIEGDLEVLAIEGITLSTRELATLTKRHKLEEAGLPGDSFSFLERLLDEHIRNKSPYLEKLRMCPLHSLEGFLEMMLTPSELETMKKLEDRQFGALWIQESFKLLRRYQPDFYEKIFPAQTKSLPSA